MRAGHGPLDNLLDRQPAAGIELTLLDCARWFHKAGGISAVAQVARDLGKRAPPAG
ncbi:MAG: hypothetical protein ACREGK_03330 [Geminicoccales bacterium]